MPSPNKARRPSPGTVTRDNPAGDAASPIDAALTRLLREPMSDQHDRWRKLAVPLPDAANWKRVRFWGYPTRAGFRYGKDPHFALGLIAYEAATGDDSPSACLRQFSARALETAALFDVEVGDVQRDVRNHKRGPEGVDWDEAGKAWKEELARREAERQERLAEQRRIGKLRREQRLAARKAAAEKKAAAAKTGQAGQNTAAEAKTGQNPGDKAVEGDADRKAGPSPAGHDKAGEPTPGGAKAKDAPANPDKEAEAATPEEDAPSGEPDAGVTAKPRANAKARLNALRRLFLRGKGEPAGPVDPQQAAAAAQKRKERLAKIRELRLRMRRAREAAEAVVPLPENLPPSTMAVLRTTGRFTTLFNRDVYHVAVVAYDSWPGTCLVQGFAVRVGSDEQLAAKVVERWLEDAAPNLRWDPALREKPIFENR